jgi:hypothetical protein
MDATSTRRGETPSTSFPLDGTTNAAYGGFSLDSTKTKLVHVTPVSPMGMYVIPTQ